MSIRRSNAQPAPGIVSLAFVVTFVVLVAMLAAPLGPAGSTARASASSRNLSVAFGAVDCASLNSNASLNGTIAGIYHGLPNVTQYWTPASNSTRPANESAYPSQSAADIELIGAWLSICQSSGYQILLDQWGSGNATGGLDLNWSTGHYQVNFGIYWHAACSNWAGNGSGYCQHSSTWSFDLVTGTVDGPITVEWGGPPLGWGPPPAPTTSDPQSNTGTTGSRILTLPSTQVVALLGAIAISAVGVSLLTILLRRRRTPPASG